MLQMKAALNGNDVLGERQTESVHGNRRQHNGWSECGMGVSLSDQSKSRDFNVGGTP